MRAYCARLAIVLGIVSAFAGCRSSGSPWGFGRKSDAPAITEGPELPTASATPPSYGSSYAAANAPQGPSAFADPAVTMPSQATPYPGQPTGYSGAGAPGVPGAPPAGYASQPAMAQQGPYNEGAAQPAAAMPQPYPSTGMPAAPQASAYAQTGPPAAVPVADPYTGQPGAGYGAPAAAPAAAPASVPPAPSQDPAGSYAVGTGGSAGDYYTADNRAAAPADPYAGQAEKAAADSYAAAGAAAEPAPPVSTSSNPGQPYRPGSTGYTPGDTGYSPPGVAPYQMAAQPNVVSAPRKDPYYRPGGTSDYAPPGGQTATASADRYQTPPIGAGHADPYALPDSYQATSPAGGGAMTR